MNEPKTKSKPAGKKLPYARVMYTTDLCRNAEMHCFDRPAPYLKRATIIVSVHPHPNLKQARAAAKWANLTEGEKVERIVRIADKQTRGNYWNPDIAKAVLRAQGSL